MCFVQYIIAIPGTQTAVLVPSKAIQILKSTMHTRSRSQGPNYELLSSCQCRDTFLLFPLEKLFQETNL